MRKFTELFEHRGKPDPEKARLRQEAHLRGIERHKNAEERRKAAEEARKNREAKRKEKEASQKKQQSKQSKQQTTQQKQQQPKGQSSKQDIQQRLQKIKQQQQTKQQQNYKQQQRQATPQTQAEVDVIKQKIDKTTSKAQEVGEKFRDSAPTQKAKNCVDKFLEKSEEIIANVRKKFENSSWFKLTDEEKERRKERMFQEIEARHQDASAEELSELKSDAELEWAKNLLGSTVDISKESVTGIADLMGYKDIYDNVKNGVNYIIRY